MVSVPLTGTGVRTVASWGADMNPEDGHPRAFGGKLSLHRSLPVVQLNKHREMPRDVIPHDHAKGQLEIPEPIELG